MILLVTPRSTVAGGNDTTVRRWASILESLGHHVRIEHGYVEGNYSALVALHARKSAQAVHEFVDRHPGAPVVVALTGTDLYPSLTASGVDPAVLEKADRLVVLQELGRAQVPDHLQGRVHVVVQSADPVTPRPGADGRGFCVAFLAHARSVKDPLRLAEAVRGLPTSSAIEVVHAGDAVEPEYGDALTAETKRNPRYAWVGQLDRAGVAELLARSRLLVVTSFTEGGANVVSEAIAAHVPVISSEIPGSVGLLGSDYPGYYPAGDTAALTRLLIEVEQNRDGLLDRLESACDAIRAHFDPRAERQAWEGLVRSFGTSWARTPTVVDHHIIPTGG